MNFHVKVTFEIRAIVGILVTNNDAPRNKCVRNDIEYIGARKDGKRLFGSLQIGYHSSYAEAQPSIYIPFRLSTPQSIPMLERVYLSWGHRKVLV